jgi:hypothetical protein
MVKYVVVRDNTFYGFIREDVRSAAYQLSVRNGIKNPFGANGMTGRTWLDHFLRHYKDKLSLSFSDQIAWNFIRSG